MKTRWLSPTKLALQWDPFEYVVWDDMEGPVTAEEIRSLVGTGDILSPDKAGDGPPRGQGVRDWHMRRVAWFVVHGWTDPIEVDVGIPVLNYWPGWGIEDGNHRYVASLVRGDRGIAAHCGGQISEMNRLRGSKKKEGQPCPKDAIT